MRFILFTLISKIALSNPFPPELLLENFSLYRIGTKQRQRLQDWLKENDGNIKKWNFVPMGKGSKPPWTQFLVHLIQNPSLVSSKSTIFIFVLFVFSFRHSHISEHLKSQRSFSSSSCSHNTSPQIHATRIHHYSLSSRAHSHSHTHQHHLLHWCYFCPPPCVAAPTHGVPNISTLKK